jgi:hypothetical protein
MTRREKVSLVEVDRLRTHEAVRKRRVRELVEEIRKESGLKRPVVVDRDSLVVLDGHHRLAALREMGVKKAPVFLVDYFSDQVKVYLRRKELMMKLIKEAVIRMGLSSQVFGCKTTRHLVRDRPRGVKIGLDKLSEE